MRGAIPPLTQYAFMAWCSVLKKEHGDDFSFTFNFVYTIFERLLHIRYYRYRKQQTVIFLRIKHHPIQCYYKCSLFFKIKSIENKDSEQNHSEVQWNGTEHFTCAWNVTGCNLTHLLQTDFRLLLQQKWKFATVTVSLWLHETVDQGVVMQPSSTETNTKVPLKQIG